MLSTQADQITRAIAAGAERLFGRQRGDGAFLDSPPGSVPGTAGAIVVLRAADPAGHADLVGGARWLPHPVRRRRLGWCRGGRNFHTLASFPDPGPALRLPLAVALFDKVRQRRISFRTAPFIGLALLQEAPGLVLANTGFLRRAVRADGAWDAVTNLDLTRSASPPPAWSPPGMPHPRLAATRDLFHRTQQRDSFPVFGVPAGGLEFLRRDRWPVTLESAEILHGLAAFPAPPTRPCAAASSG